MSALVTCHSGFRLQHRDRAVRESLSQPPRGRESYDPASDHEEIGMLIGSGHV